MYDKGQGVPQDYKEAETFSKQMVAEALVSSFSKTNAQYNLGVDV